MGVSETACWRSEHGLSNLMTRTAFSLSIALLLAACASIPPTEVLPPAPPAPPGTEAQSVPYAPRRSPFEEPPGVYSSEVTQMNIGKTICVAGWIATVRPSTSFSQGVKRLMLARAGLDLNDAGAYELDHFVPLALAVIHGRWTTCGFRDGMVRAPRTGWKGSCSSWSAQAD